ncbi:hypothetical protein Acidovoranil_12700 [Acidovorax sp. FG27]
MQRQREPQQRQAPCQSQARHGRALNRPGMPGRPCSEVKEEAKPGDIRGRGRPAVPARAQTSRLSAPSAFAPATTNAMKPTDVPGAIPC